MTQQSSFAGFNFTNVWEFRSGVNNNNPVLRENRAALTGTASISGVVAVGNILTANLTGSNNTGSLSYQWRRGNTNVGTGITYTPTAADIGSTLTVVITSSVQTGSVTSPATAAVIQAALTGTASVSGTPQVGQVLNATLSGSNNTGNLIYQWRRGTTNVGTNSSTYALTAADVGSNITVVVTSSVQTG
jgi:hypothetical protein